jgi:transcriptional regulator with XRE-family HTH domain
MAREPEALIELRRALGERLLAYRKLAGLTQGDLGRKLFCDRTVIARLEQGQRIKDQRFWQHADDALQAGGRLLTAFGEWEAAKAEHERQRLEAERDRCRRQITAWQQEDSRRSSGESHVPPEGCADVSSAASVATVDPSEWIVADGDPAASVRNMVARLVDLDTKFGGRDVAPLAVRAFRNARRYLGSGCYPSHQESDLYAAVGELAEVGGWICFDAEKQAQSHALSQEALFLCRLVGDRRTELLTLLNMSGQTAYVGKWRESLLIADSVLDTFSLSPRVEAMFRLRQARLFSKTGQHHETLRSFERISALFSEGVSDRDPDWAWWIDQTELDGQHGAALAELGEWDKSIPLLSTAIELRGMPHYHVSFHVRLLSVFLKSGAWRDAESTVEELVHRADEIGSARAVTEIRNVGKFVHSCSDCPPALGDGVHHLVGMTRLE